MKRCLQLLFVAIFLLLSSGSLFAATGQQLAAIEALGDLNGLALSCRHLDQTQLMKRAMVETLPRQKALGDLFDQASNDRFVAFNNELQLCPRKSEFRTAVGQAIEKLKQVFKKAE